MLKLNKRMVARWVVAIVGCLAGMVVFFWLWGLGIQLALRLPDLLGWVGRGAFEGLCLGLGFFSFVALNVLRIVEARLILPRILQAFLVAGFTVWLVMWPLSIIITFAPLD